MARYGSVLFLLLQGEGLGWSIGTPATTCSLPSAVFIIIDLAYSVHEWLLARMEAEDARLEAAGWEPGPLSNIWKVLYTVGAFLVLSLSIVGLGVMFKYFALCPLHQFFLAETLILGILFTLLSCASFVHPLTLCIHATPSSCPPLSVRMLLLLQ